MIRRWEVRFKCKNAFKRPNYSSRSFFTLIGAENYVDSINDIIRDIDKTMDDEQLPIVVAVVWDRKFDTQYRF